MVNIREIEALPVNFRAKSRTMKGCPASTGGISLVLGL